MKIKSASLASLLSVLLFSQRSHAADVRWSGATDIDWNVGTNWVGDAAPASSDTVSFAAPGVGGLSLNNNLTSGSFTINGILFTETAGAYVIGDGTNTANAGNSFVLGTPAGTAAFPLSVTNASSSTQTINTPIALNGTRTFTGLGDLVVTGNISGGSAGLVKQGGNTLTLAGNNTYTGSTTISLGVLRLDSANAIPGGIGVTGGTSNISFNSGIIGLAAGNFSRPLGSGASSVNFGSTGGWAAFGADRSVNLGGASAPVVWVTATTGLNNRVLVLSHPTATHTLDFQNPLDLTNGGRFIQVDDGAAAIDGILSGNVTGVSGGTLTKNGGGTLALTGAANNYPGSTTINAGVVLVNGTKSGTGAITVNNGAALGGTGSITGATNVQAGGRMNLLNGSVGNLNFTNNITFNGTSASPNILSFELGNGAAGTDQIITAGAHNAASSNGALVFLHQLSGTPLDPGTYALIQGGATSNMSGYSLATQRAGHHVYSNLVANGNNLDVDVAAGDAGPAVPFLYWRGETAGDWDLNTEWYTDAAGLTPAAAIPGYSTNVRFATANADILATSLFQDFEINSLTTDAGLAAPVTIGTQMLTIGATADNSNTLGNGITANNENGTTISSRVGLGNSQTWTVGTDATLTVSGAVYDFGAGHALTKAGPGTLNLSAVNVFSGPLTIQEGTLAITGSGQLNSGIYNANMVNNGTFAYNSSAAQSILGIISGSGSFVKSGSGTLTQMNSWTLTGGATISGGTLSLGSANLVNPLGTGTTTVSTGGTYALSATLLTAPLVLNGGTVNVGNSFTSTINSAVTLDAVSTLSVTGNLTVNGNITGTGGLTKTGSAFIPLNGTNDYSGPTTIGVNGGGLTIKSSLYGNDTAQWIPDNITVNSGGALVLNVGAPGEFTIAQAGTMFSQLGGAVNNNGLRAGSVFGVDFRNTTGTFLISDDLTDSSGPGGGSVSFRIVGNGTTGSIVLELQGENTYSGQTIVDRSGTVKVSSINSVNGGSPPLTTSSLGRPTTIANGTIQLGSNASFQGGSLTYTGGGETTDRVVNFGGANNSVYTFDQSGSGLLKFTSDFTMTDRRGPQTIVLQGSTSSDGEMAGVLPTGDGASPNRLTKNGTGKWILSGANLNAGIVTLTDGVLSVSTIGDGGISGAATTTANNAVVNLTTGTTAGMSVGMAVASTAIPIGSTVASINSATQFTLSSGTGVTAATARGLVIGTPGNLGMAPGSASNLVFNGGTLQYTGSAASTNRNFTINAGKVAAFDITTSNLTITGASTNTNGGLNKLGNGTLTLNGTNLHTGVTTVSAGTLSLGTTGSVANSSSVAIAAGATFDTSGQAAYAIPTGKPVAFGLDATGPGSSGKINASELNIANATVTYNITGTPDDPAYVLATYTTLTGGSFLSAPTPPAGYTLDYAYEGNKIALVSAGTPYDTWADGTFTNTFSNKNKEVDFDNDGLSNLLEFVLGGDPTISQPGIAPAVTASGSDLVVTFKRSDVSKLAPSTGVKIEVSDDLTFSTPANDITIGNASDPGPIAPTGASYTVSNSGGFDTITVTIPKGAATKKFARVKATHP